MPGLCARLFAQISWWLKMLSGRKSSALERFLECLPADGKYDDPYELPHYQRLLEPLEESIGQENSRAYAIPRLTSANLRCYEITTTSTTMSKVTSKTINYTEPVFNEELENLRVFDAWSFKLLLRYLSRLRLCSSR